MKQSVFTVLLPDKRLRAVVGLLRELGYDGVEIRVQEDYHLSPSSISSRLAEVKSLQAEYGLQVPVLGTYLPVVDHDALLPVFRAAEELGAYGVRVSLGQFGNSGDSYWQRHDAARRGIERLTRALRPCSVKALFEIHFKTIISSPSLAYLLLKDLDPVGVGAIYDPGNMVIEGAEAPQLGVQVVKDYLAHVHIKDASWRMRDGKWSHEWEELGRGMACLEEVIAALKAVGYDGYLSNENLKDVLLPGATGFIGETLSSDRGVPATAVSDKLAADQRYIAGLLEKA